MTRKELNELKQQALAHKDRSVELDEILASLKPVIITIRHLLPKALVRIFDKYAKAD